MKDSEIKKLINAEELRQAQTLNLIASENYVSPNVREALASVFTNKYAEGYPGARYYGGNSIVDDVECLCQRRALKLFGLSPKVWNVNVQPYSGSPANLAVYLALVPLGEKIMGLRLDMGGHLTHGHRVNATGKLWKQIPYDVDARTEVLNYDVLMKIAKREKPKLIVAGFTAYSRVVDFKKFRRIANAAGAILLVDMSHFAGLVAGHAYPSPFSAKGGQALADVVTTTTHKTLRGPRGAVIFSRLEFSEKIDKAVFPGLQGGPHINNIAAMATALEEASRPAFKKYAKQITKNTKTLAQELKHRGWRIVSGETDSHLFLVDTFARGVGGKEASSMLEEAGIVVNKNAIPYDARSPRDPSGIRIGTPAVTTRGMREREMKFVARWIDKVLSGARPQKVSREIASFLKKFPLP